MTITSHPQSAGGTEHLPCRMVEVAASLGISSLKDSDRGQDPVVPYICIQ